MKYHLIRLLRSTIDSLPSGLRSLLRSQRRRLELAYLFRTDIVQYRTEKARDMGVRVGKGCRFFSLQVFSEPSLVEVGNDVIVSGEVKFLTHDGAVLTFAEEIPNVVGHYGRISVGDNTFIGFGVTILPNVSIGRNCIIAAGSVVMDSFPDDSVIAGNPAKVIFPRSMYLAMKQSSPYTIIDERYQYPAKYPQHLLEERIGALPIRPPRRASRAATRKA